MRKITAITIAIFAVMSILLSANVAAAPSKEISEDISEKLILQLLYQPTVSAVDTYYGEHRRYWQQELLSVQKISQSLYYEVIIQVETFCDAHNPPYGIETITSMQKLLERFNWSALTTKMSNSGLPVSSLQHYYMNKIVQCFPNCFSIFSLGNFTKALNYNPSNHFETGHGEKKIVG